MLNLLELVTFDCPRTTAQLAEAAAINRTVAHRLLNTLNERGYVSRDGKVFIPGPMLRRMALVADQCGIPLIARPVLAQLSAELGESIVMHRIDGDDAVVVEQAISEAEVVRVQHREGARHPLPMGASGRALLAFQPEAVIKRHLGRAEDPVELGRLLAATRESGIARSKNELQRGVAGLAVPLHEPAGIVRYSLAVLAPTQRSAGLDTKVGKLVEAQRTVEALIADKGR
ncbi:IclR family transcriptional regulator [Pseudogemmobacter sonorensis]|uniref:IclR family transcriptional regulator n=1 Tax=Pseudogemmobacter sonorensis TaxID=2989681 RepID=UPI0036CFA34C